MTPELARETILAELRQGMRTVPQLAGALVRDGMRPEMCYAETFRILRELKGEHLVRHHDHTDSWMIP